MTREQRIKRLIAVIPELSNYRLQLIGKIADVFQQPKEFRRSSDSSLITAGVLEDFGDILRMHHCFSREPFTKDKFEYALERVLIEARVTAQLAPRGQRGYDIESPQNPKPGYCYVEEDGKLLFSLYFDGGGERKLQVKHLQKPLCKVHATWKFELSTETL